MKVSKSELIGIISKIKPGLDRKEIIEQASHFIFSQDEVATFNDRICILHPFTCEFPFSVKGEEFSKILSGISESEINLSIKEGTLHIKTKSTNAKLSTVLGAESKVDHLIAQIKKEISGADFFKPLPKEFIDGLYLCAFSANKDIATGVRACVAIKADTIYATDNIRASTYIMDSSTDEMLIPAKDALELVKYPVKEYGISENWIHFRTEDGIVFNCKTMKGEYPYKMVSGIFSDQEANLEFPTGLKEAVASVVILADGEMDINKMIRITAKKGEMIIKAENERGSIDKTVDFAYDGEPFEFIINPIFLTQILNHAAKFTLVDGMAQFESGNFFHVMSLPTE